MVARLNPHLHQIRLTKERDEALSLVLLFLYIFISSITPWLFCDFSETTICWFWRSVGLEQIADS